ncbi:MAG: DUF2085 domain-containing protein [Coriobacteriales bacterium]|jgi:uncharacterized membrane protein|nr:DUF2085 domain-containing protein [Coriobacteriales bacterium]
MLDILQQIVYFFGRGFCHQFTSRSFEAGGLYFGVCARDTGIFLGLFITALIICTVFVHRNAKFGGMPSPSVVVCSILLIMPMALDGLSSYTGLRETTNFIRYITGYLCGIGVGMVAAPAVSGLWQANNPAQSLPTSPVGFIPVILGSSAIGAVFYLVYPYLGVTAAILLALVEWAVFTAVALLIITSTRLWPLTASNTTPLVSTISQEGASKRSALPYNALSLRNRKMLLIFVAVAGAFAFIATGALTAEFLELLLPGFVHP